MNGQSNHIHSSSFKELTSYIDWELVTKRFNLSLKTKRAFYNEDFKRVLAEMASSEDFFVPTYDFMSRRIQKVKYRELVYGLSSSHPTECTSKNVSVLELPAKAFKSPAYTKRSTGKAVSQKALTQFTSMVRQETTITINISGGKSISFNTSTPEESVAKLLRSLEQY